MDKYRKLIAAVVGIVAMVLNDFFDVSVLLGIEETIINLIIGALTAWGVWGFKNEVPSPEEIT